MQLQATMGTGMQVQAALLLCLVLLAASPRVALGNCSDDCMSACNGWPLVCRLSCTSACYGGEGITTLSTSAESATAEAPAPAPAAAARQEGGVSVLRGLKPSPARG